MTEEVSQVDQSVTLNNGDTPTEVFADSGVTQVDAQQQQPQQENKQEQQQQEQQQQQQPNQQNSVENSQNVSQSTTTTESSLNSVPQAHSSEGPPVKLFIGQVPKNFFESELQKIFEPFGTVKQVEIIRDKTTGEHRGCAFLTYASRSSAESAMLALHQKLTLPPAKHPLQVRYSESEAQSQQQTKLFIGMLPKDYGETELRSLFSVYGEVEEVKLLRGTSDGSKGCAFVKYRERQSALTAIAGLNGFTVTSSSGINSQLAVRFADSERQKQQRQLLKAAIPFFQQQQHQPAYGALAYGTATHAYTTPTTFANYGYGLPSGTPVISGPQTEGPPGANLFIMHLPQEFRDQDLAITFAPFGSVLSAKVFIDKNTGESKCFGRQSRYD